MIDVLKAVIRVAGKTGSPAPGSTDGIVVISNGYASARSPDRRCSILTPVPSLGVPDGHYLATALLDAIRRDGKIKVARSDKQVKLSVGRWSRTDAISAGTRDPVEPRLDAVPGPLDLVDVIRVVSVVPGASTAGIGAGGGGAAMSGTATAAVVCSSPRDCSFFGVGALVTALDASSVLSGDDAPVSMRFGTDAIGFCIGDAVVTVKSERGVESWRGIAVEAPSREVSIDRDVLTGALDAAATVATDAVLMAGHVTGESILQSKETGTSVRRVGLPPIGDGMIVPVRLVRDFLTATTGSIRAVTRARNGHPFSWSLETGQRYDTVLTVPWRD